MAVCAHTACTCEAEAGSEYCSSFCETHATAPDCHCHHEGCAAPHHH